jgi:putative peptidoglycan lipid II flippase
VTLLSRVAGLVREVLIARVFGATAVGSAFAFAFAAPNLFRRLFGEGALSAAFLPEFAQLSKHDAPAASIFAARTLRMVGAVTSAIAGLTCAGIVALLLLLPADPERELSLGLLSVTMLYMPLVCVVAILAGMLQVHGRFAAAASGPVLLNGVLVAVGAYYLLAGKTGGAAVAYALAAATVASGVTQCATFLWLLRHKAHWRTAGPGEESAAQALRRMGRRFVPALIGMGTLQLSTLADQLIAMYPNLIGPTFFGHPYPLAESSNILINNAQRLYQFPLGVFGIAVATAVFPLLSRTADDRGAFAATLRRGVRLSLFIGLPASVGLLLVRHDACYVLYGGGVPGAPGSAPRAAYNADELARVAAVVLAYAPAVWVYSINHLFTRAFFAKGDTARPMRVGLWIVGLNLALNAGLIWALGEPALAWSTTIAATAQCLWLAFLLRRAHGVAPLDRPAAAGAARLVAATFAMAAACVAVLWLWPAPSSWGAHAGRLAGLTAVGAAAYAAACAILRAPELGWLLRRDRPE